MTKTERDSRDDGRKLRDLLRRYSEAIREAYGECDCGGECHLCELTKEIDAALRASKGKEPR